mgnify:CR=1 FL=1
MGWKWNRIRISLHHRVMLIAPLLAVLLLPEPGRAQIFPYRFLDTPSHNGRISAVRSRAVHAFIHAGGRLAIHPAPWPNGLGPKIRKIDRFIPREELRETVIALDSASRPWVLTAVHLYRPVLRDDDWEFLTEQHGLDIRPAFLAVAPWGSFYTARTGSGMLCSTDSCVTWTEEGPTTSGDRKSVV